MSIAPFLTSVALRFRPILKRYRLVFGILAGAAALATVAMLGWPEQARSTLHMAKVFIVGSDEPATNVTSQPPASPVPSISPTDVLLEKITALEKRQHDVAAEVATLKTQLQSAQGDYQAALHEVATHNDLLEQKSSELSAALENIGLAPLATKETIHTTQASKKVNINTADVAALMTLPGIGQSYAERIIAYRTEHGPFTSIDELDNVSGIGQATIAKLRDAVTI